MPTSEFDLPHFSENVRGRPVVTGRAAWRRTEGEAGVDGDR